MKKTVTIILAITIVLTLGIGIFAQTGFVPSIEVKTAPEIIPPAGYGEDVVALLLNSEDKVIGTVKAPELIITPFSNKEDPEIYKMLKEAYDEIVSKGLSGVLSDDIKKAFKEKGSNVDKLIVNDIFDIYYSEAATLSENNKLNITFKTGFLELKDSYNVFVIVKTNGTWKMVPLKDVKITADGNLNVSFTEVCPVAFLIDRNPHTSDNTTLIAWIVVAVISLAAIIAVIIFTFKRKKN